MRVNQPYGKLFFISGWQNTLRGVYYVCNQKNDVKKVTKGAKNMGYTKFGKIVRKEMIDHDENLLSIARLLGVTTSFVSNL